jgi:outer membrane lipoprotein-sorting protein
VTLIEVLKTERREDDEWQRVRVYVDTELHIPIRYEAHDWPATEGGELQLLEEYTYLHVKINQGFTDRDFDMNNPDYSFPEMSMLSSPLKGIFGRGD